VAWSWVGQQTELTLATVLVDPTTGDYDNTLVSNLFYVDYASAATGIATFDQHGRLFFATNYEDNYVFGSNLKTNTSLPPFSVNADKIISLDYDSSASRLLIGAYYKASDSIVLYAIYDDPPHAEKYANLTALGIPNTILSTTVLVRKFFIAYESTTSPGSYFITSFDTDNPTKVFTVPFGCGPHTAPVQIFLDPYINSLIGIASIQGGTQNYLFKLDSIGECFIYSIPRGRVLGADFNPLTRTLYMDTFQGFAWLLVTIDVETGSYTLANTDSGLIDIAVSWQIG